MSKQPHLTILPSTEHHLRSAESDRIAGRGEIVSAAGLDHARAVSTISRICGGERPPLQVFSDQLVDAEDAPIPVVQHGKLLFFPALESLLVSRFQYTALLWTKDGFIDLTNQPFERVLAGIARYLDDCHQLEHWLARQLQWQRGAEARARAANSEIRRFRSAAMFAYTRQHKSMDERMNRILDRTDAAIQRNKVQA